MEITVTKTSHEFRSVTIKTEFGQIDTGILDRDECLELARQFEEASDELADWDD